MTLCSLASGSMGNSIYIANDSGDAVLVDAGLSLKRLEERAGEAGVDLNRVKAVLVTHEHRDHVAGLAAFVKKYNVQIYAHESCYLAMSEAVRGQTVDDRERSFHIGDMEIIPFRMPHDSDYMLGYRIYSRSKSVSIATDLGCVTDAVFSNMAGSDAVLIESNHDEDMLKNGTYPYMLKRRIMSNNGHLSNRAAARFIGELAHAGTHRFVLGHLSEHNNAPELAYDTAMAALRGSCKNLNGYELDIALQNKTSVITV